MNAKEKLIDLIGKSGWELDTSCTIPASRYGTDRKQNPNIFLRPAAHGGTWRITLKWSQTGSWSSRRETNTLHKVHVAWIPDDDEVPTDGGGRRLGKFVDELENRENHAYGSQKSWLWEVLDDENLAKPRTLRQRAELLVSQPDLAIWEAKKAEHEDRVRRSEVERQKAFDKKLRARPLAITIEQSAFRQLAYALEKTTNQLYRADGKSDLPALVKQAQEQLDAIAATLVQDPLLDIVNESETGNAAAFDEMMGDPMSNLPGDAR